MFQDPLHTDVSINAAYRESPKPRQPPMRDRTYAKEIVTESAGPEGDHTAHEQLAGMGMGERSEDRAAGSECGRDLPWSWSVFSSSAIFGVAFSSSSSFPVAIAAGDEEKARGEEEEKKEKEEPVS